MINADMVRSSHLACCTHPDSHLCWENYLNCSSAVIQSSLPILNPCVSNWQSPFDNNLVFFFNPSLLMCNHRAGISMLIAWNCITQVWKALLALPACVCSPPLLSDVVAPVLLWGVSNPSPISCLFSPPWQPCDVHKAFSSCLPLIPQLGNQPYYSSVTNNQRSLSTMQHCALRHFYLLCHDVQVWSLCCPTHVDFYLFIYFQPAHHITKIPFYFFFWWSRSPQVEQGSKTTEWQTYRMYFQKEGGRWRTGGGPRSGPWGTPEQRGDGSVGLWSEK